MNTGPQQFLQDDTGAYSIKRLVFAVFCVLYVGLAITPLWRWTDASLYAFLTSTLDKVKEILFWLGGYILVENVTPAVTKAVQRQT